MHAIFSKKLNYFLLFSVSVQFLECWPLDYAGEHWNTILKVSHVHFWKRCVEDTRIGGSKEKGGLLLRLVSETAEMTRLRTGPWPESQKI